ncbi:MAG: GAF domain-containing protein, partial [Bacilli bacterium]
GLVVQNGEPHIAKDVRLLENYIACDNLTLSEIVLPLQIRGKIIGVLDIDSYILAAFDQADLNGLQKLLNILSLSLNGQFAV